MTSLIVPELDADPWPTLGPEVCDFIEATWVYGPGPLQGLPYVIEPEFRAWIYRVYEVFPQGHPREGKRRFKRGVLSIRKGTAKTEKGAIITATESHPDAPVRCDGFNAAGEPVGRGVVSPFIPMMAYTKDQTEDLGYAVVKSIIGESDCGWMYDVGEDRILLMDHRGREAGKIAAYAGSPNSNDGARTTFQNFDETHRLYLPAHVKAHTTMLQNTFKRRDADAWSMEQSTAPEAGQGSVHEDALEYAKQVAAGKIEDPRLFMFHRQATFPDGGLETRDQVRAYLLEASGPSADWSADIEGLVDHYFEPKTDRIYYRRVWGNETVAGGGKAFDPIRWGQIATPGRVVRKKAFIALGFDGARTRDATALIATLIPTARGKVDIKALSGFHQWPIGIWERPAHTEDGWEVDEAEVTAALNETFGAYQVALAFCDPHHWGPTIDTWAGKHGDAIVKYDTTKTRAIGYVFRDYKTMMGLALTDEELAELGGVLPKPRMTHNGDALFAEHVVHAYKSDLRLLDEDTEEPLWTLQKERRDSPLKIDAAMAGGLSMRAALEAVAKGMRPRSKPVTARRVR